MELDIKVVNHFHNNLTEDILQAKACQSLAKPCQANTCVDCLSDSYFNGNPVSYDCEQKTKVYVCRYLPCHTSEILEALNKIPKDFRSFLTSKTEINIASIGFGPGSDMVAFTQFIGDNKYDDAKREIFEEAGLFDNLEVVNHIIIDNQFESWANAIDEVYEIANTLNAKNEITYTLFNSTHYPAREDVEIFILSYVISELILEEHINNIIHLIKQYAGNRFIILVNDRNEENVLLTAKRFLEKLRECFNFSSTVEMLDNREKWIGRIIDDNIRNLYKSKTNKKSFYCLAEFLK